MKRITKETSAEVLDTVVVGDFVTDGFSKTGKVEQIRIANEGLFKLYEFTLITDRIIRIKK